jgi:molybdenum cofactor biosynthesis enzyme MoaA
MSHNQYPWARIAGATLSVATVYMIHQAVSEYGWEGALNYVWVGDPYDGSPVGKYLKVLQEADLSMGKEETRISEIEEALDRARLDSVEVDKNTMKEVVILWMANYPGLEKALAGLDNKLDKVAAKIDGVLLSKTNSSSHKVQHKVQELKKKKKLLSKKLVVDMERCDALMASYKVLQD